MSRRPFFLHTLIGGAEDTVASPPPQDTTTAANNDPATDNVTKEEEIVNNVVSEGEAMLSTEDLDKINFPVDEVASKITADVPQTIVENQGVGTDYLDSTKSFAVKAWTTVSSGFKAIKFDSENFGLWMIVCLILTWLIGLVLAVRCKANGKWAHVMAACTCNPLYLIYYLASKNTRLACAGHFRLKTPAEINPYSNIGSTNTYDGSTNNNPSKKTKTK